MIRVLLVDDHELVRTGIKRLLEDVEDIQVVGEAESGEAAIEKVREDAPDVVLMDVSMPGIGGMEATRRLMRMQPDLKIITLTIHADNPFPIRLIKAGAKGYLTKGSKPEEMLRAIREVNGGQRYISPEVAQQMAAAIFPDSDSPFSKLSERELQIMLMLTQGHSGTDISEHLCLSPKTVSTYRHRLFSKLGVNSEAELTRLAMRHGIFDGVS